MDSGGRSDGPTGAPAPERAAPGRGIADGAAPRRRTGRFQRADRLRSPRDFRRVSREGRRRRSPHFVMLVAPKRLEVEREAPALGLTVSRKVGRAVRRNRVKRRVREWFRHHRGELPPRSDVVVIARPGAAELRNSEIERELSGLLR